MIANLRTSCAVALLSGLALPLLAALAKAEDPLGTAGPFRSMAWAKCEAGVLAQFRGACDPPPVDENLPKTRQSGAHVERALKLIALGRIPQAKESLDAAIAADPRNVAAFKLRARTTISGGGQGAETDVNAGLLLDPTDPDLLAMRGWLLNDTRNNPMAGLYALDEAIRISPDNADALWLRRASFSSTIGYKKRRLTSPGRWP